jgi:uncharacterized membrane protein
MAGETESGDESALPFVAPCRVLRVSAPLTWLRMGLADFRHAWPQSLAYGAFMAAAMGLVTWLAWRYGSYWFMLAMVGGFVFIAPLTCTGLYVLSAQLERGQPPSLRQALRSGVRLYIGNELVFTLLLLVIFLVWARAGAMLAVFFPARGQPALRDLVAYLGIGSAVGVVFAALTFAVSAFSLPMIVHRRVDAVTAAVTSINAVLRNRRAMIVWFGLIVAGVLVGFATLFIGLAIILPVIGHAAWHGYLDAIDARGFPLHESGATAGPEVRS